ncbi:MAG TPA: helix-turn-helix transcriptional regulator [Gaiellaceae bacterium]|nr:helix-turn-helix transcriptional regulator [Gaiellaceae bacterium]
MQSDGPPTAGETIGERLKRLRLERGLSQRELAAPGVSYAYISRIEAGTRQPSVKALRRLAEKLGVSADYLETGSSMDPRAARELRVADLELAMRLGEAEGVEEPLQAAIAEALAAGDVAVATRARITLALHLQTRLEYDRAVVLLEDALESDAFDPVERMDLYASLGKAYTDAGRPQDAVVLFERCMHACAEAGAETAEARYATLLSYVLSDMGDLGRAENVLARALTRVGDSGDPYMRVRLYWSMARLAHTEGRESVALTNVRKAIALLQATEDTLNLARAHILAAYIMLSREDHQSAANHLNEAEALLGPNVSAQEQFEITTQRARVAALRGNGPMAVDLARVAVRLAGTAAPSDRGLALAALGEGLTLMAQFDDADDAYAEAVELLESQGRWRHAATAAHARGRMLRLAGREDAALDALEHAAELGTRALPESTHAAR